MGEQRFLSAPQQKVILWTLKAGPSPLWALPLMTWGPLDELMNLSTLSFLIFKVAVSREK